MSTKSYKHMKSKNRIAPLRSKIRQSQGISMLELTLVLPLVLGLILVLINQGIRSYNRSAVIYALTEAGQRAKADPRLEFDKWDSNTSDPKYQEYKEARQELADAFKQNLPSGVDAFPVQHYDALQNGNSMQQATAYMGLVGPGDKISIDVGSTSYTFYHPTVCLKNEIAGNGGNNSVVPISGSQMGSSCTADKAVDPASSDLMELYRTEPMLLCAVVKTFSIFGEKLETLCSSTFLSDAEVGGVQPTHTPTPNDCDHTGCGCDANGKGIYSASQCLGCLQNSPYGIRVISINTTNAGGTEDTLNKNSDDTLVTIQADTTVDNFIQNFDHQAGEHKSNCLVKDWTIIWNRFGGCFDPETKIKLADGSSRRAIDIHDGDVLLNGKTGEKMKVTRVIAGPEEKPMVRVGYSESSVLTISQEHPVVTKRGLVQARELTKEDELLGEDKEYHKVSVLETLPVKEGQKVINYEVETLDGKRIAEPYVVSDGIVTGEYTTQQKLAESKKNRK